MGLSKKDVMLKFVMMDGSVQKGCMLKFVMMDGSVQKGCTLSFNGVYSKGCISKT